MQNNNFENSLKNGINHFKEKNFKNQKKNLIKVLFKITSDRKKY